jgi:O-methyltransferase
VDFVDVCLLFLNKDEMPASFAATKVAKRFERRGVEVWLTPSHPLIVRAEEFMTNLQMRAPFAPVQWLHHRLPGYNIRQALRRRACALPGVSQHVLVSGHTWLPPARLKMLERHVRTVERCGVVGDIVECGVAKGGSAALLGLTLDRQRSSRRLYLFDTFEGLPAPTAKDPDYDQAVTWIGKCRGDLDDVKSLLRSLNVDLDRIKFVKGLFQETLPVTHPERVAVAHLDGDWYESTMTCLTNLWPLLSVGGIIQLDDYGMWQGCRVAVDEFFASRQSEIAVRPIDKGAIYIRRLTATSR